MKEMIQNAVDAIRAVAGARPSVGLILGSGLGGLADVLEDASFVEYASIPGFPVSTAPGHAGRFVLGRLAGANPLTGPNDAGFGPRFCDMTYAYTPALRRLADEVAAAQGVALRHGVYLGYMGPSYETPAEIRAFRVLGADAVGMSTVPEVIAASHCGLPVLAISLVTNMAAGVLEKKLDENEVIETAAARAKVLERLVTGIVERL